MLSHAQNLEDVLLSRVFPHDDGFYIDVGANDPEYHSVTKLLYDRGWSGINIEPMPAMCARLRDARQRDVTLNVGLASREAELTFFETPTIHGWSTFSPALAASYRERGIEVTERPVPVTTLALVCERWAARPIDFLKIDVEGFEREVLAGGDWARWRPRVVLVENAWPQEWEPLILGADYFFAASDRLNRYYLRAEDRDLLAAFAAHIEDLHAVIEQLHAALDARAKLIDAYEERLRQVDVGETTLRVARRLHRMAQRYPRTAATVRRFIRLSAW
jgi:FkbM family methyltransferase